MAKRFEVAFYFVSWTDISIGVNLDLKAPRTEMHIPFGFVSVGFRERSERRPLNWRQLTNTYYLFGNPHYERMEV